MAATLRTYKIRCYLNPAQERIVRNWFGATRWIWNHGLEMRTKAWARRKERVNSIAIDKHIATLKKLPRFSWLAETPSTCITQCLRDQDKALANFFRRVKAGEKPGYPKFRSRHRSSESLRFQGVGVRAWGSGRVSLMKFGMVRLAEALPKVERPKMATLKREPDGRYYITFCATVEIDLLPVVGSAIGIDLGLTHLATLSSGEKIENPRHYMKRLRYLKQQQRALCRKKKGSKRRAKQRLRVARIHAKVKNQRDNALHNLTTRLIREHQIIAIEDLAVANMKRNRSLAKHINDAGWREFRRQIEYKAGWYGRTVVVLDRWFPSSKTCGACGHKLDEMRLDVRLWDCPKCGAGHDRDTNAAQNLLVAAMHQLGGGEHRDLLADGAFVNAPREARTGQMAAIYEPAI